MLAENVSSLERLFLQVNERCDSRCRLCDFWVGARPREIQVSWVRNHVVPMVRSYGVQFTCITGGEPTLHLELPEIAQVIRSAGSLVTLITSGTRLQDHFPKIAESLSAYLFSFDGADRATYRSIRGIDFFDELVQWPDKIRRLPQRAHIALSCVIQKRNVHQLPEIYRLTRRIGADCIFFRVPDLKPYNFGRFGELAQHTLDATVLTSDECKTLQTSMAEVLAMDQEEGVLAQRAEVLWEKVAVMTAASEGEFNAEVRCCDVPFRSLVIGPNNTVSPCFYLPFSQQSDDFKEPDPNLPIIRTVRKQLLEDSEFRETHCSRCFQFDGHRV